MSFEIVTDSTSNLSLEQLKEHNIRVISLSHYIDGKEYCDYEKWLKEDCTNFFKLVKEKHHMTSSLPPYDEYSTVFNSLAEKKKDILYIGFSSALSATYDTINIFLEDIRKQYTTQKILSVDSLSGSSGEGLLVDYAIKLRAEGKSIDEVYTQLEQYKYKICHEFMVDDLFYLKRSGRISATAAIAGLLLKIKPILHVNNNGIPEMISKVRGRKAGLNTLISNMEKSMKIDEHQKVYICHADCLSDAEYLSQELKKRFHLNDIVIRYSEPVIGLHTGAGAIGLFFVGKQR